MERGFAFSQDFLQEFNSQSVPDDATSWNTDSQASQNLLGLSGSQSAQLVPQLPSDMQTTHRSTIRNKYTLPQWGRASSVDHINNQDASSTYSRSNGVGGRDLMMGVQAKRLEAERRDTRDHLMALSKLLEGVKRDTLMALREVGECVVKSGSQTRLEITEIKEKLSVNEKQTVAFHSGFEQVFKDCLNAKSAEMADSISTRGQKDIGKTLAEYTKSLEQILEAKIDDKQPKIDEIQSVLENFGKMQQQLMQKMSDMEKMVTEKFKQLEELSKSVQEPTEISVNLLEPLPPPEPQSTKLMLSPIQLPPLPVDTSTPVVAKPELCSVTLDRSDVLSSRKRVKRTLSVTNDNSDNQDLF